MHIDDFKQLTKAEKQRVLAALQAGQATAGDGVRHPRLVCDPRGADEPFPLTDLQGAYLAAKANPVRHDPAGCHVYLEFETDRLDVERLRQAWEAVVAAHPMLRAEVMANGSQRIRRDAALPAFPCADHANDPAAAARHVQAVRDELSHRCYRPGEWPLYEIRVTHLPAARSRVHVSMDSWIADARSADLIYRQWHACYVDPAQVPAAPTLQFRDFIHSMAAFRASEGHARCLAYWRERLADCPDGPALPYSGAMEQPPTEPGNRRRIAWRLPADVAGPLLASCTQQRLSPTAALLTLFCEVLRAWSSSARFGLILTMQNRPPLHPDMGQVVGPFTSTALFDADVMAAGMESESVAQRAGRYGAQLLEAMNNGYVSAMTALRALGPAQGPRAFPVVFTSLMGAAPAGGWNALVDHGVAQTPGTALHCQVKDAQGAIDIVFDCVPAWFEGGLVERLRDGFDAVLRSVVADPAAWQAADLAAACAPLAAMPDTVPVDTATVPMTALQQGYLVDRLRNPGRASGYILRSFAIDRLDPARMQAAFDSLLADHPMLRAYPNARGALECGPAVAAYTIPLEDAADASAVDAAGQALLAEFAADRQWPGLRLRMLRYPDGAGALVTLLDMALFDGHVSWMFYSELFGRYLGGTYSREGTQWKAWLAARTSTPAPALDVQYWRKRFATMAAGPALLPAAAPMPGMPATVRWEHEVAHGAALERMAARHRTTVEAAALALLAGVLAWDDAPFALGVVDYGLRVRQPALLHGFGDASRFAWAESQPRAGHTVLALARLLKRQLDTDRLHAAADPFQGLRAAQAAGRTDVRRSAVLTNCLDAPAACWPDIAVSGAASDTPGVDLDCMLARSGGGMALCWTVRTTCDLAVLRERFGAFCAALDRLAADEGAWLAAPSLPASALRAPRSLPAATDPQRLAQLARWNATDRPYDRAVCMHTLFERQAAANPYAVAVVSDAEALTYQELEQEACRLAHYLHQNGVRRGDLVAVMLSRSNRLVATLLAVLKCGAAFIPLNIDDPAARIGRVLEQAGARFVVSTGNHYGRFGAEAPAGRTVLLLDADGDAIAAQPSSFAPPEAVQAEDRAYIIFTSGSTGTPKGVIVRHRPVINLLEWAAREFGFGPSDRVLFVNPLSFDLAIFDLFGMLAYGASIRIVSDADRGNALAVAGYLRDEPITFWNSAPAYLQMLLPFLQGAAALPVERLRLAFLSGDWIPLAMPDALRAVAPNCRFISLGGATEATVWSNYYVVEQCDPAWRSIPYGRPIQNARYYILDEQGQPVAPGEQGDLFIGGECLSDGYINEPALTAKSFVPDPLHEAPGAIMYRTGDRARFYPDGNIEFLGRIDQQVKLRGYRIELGEIEAALEGCGLARAVAVVRDGDPGGRRLVGFAAADSMPAGELRDDALWASLKARLPAYMVPAQVCVLPALPITANGKVDRKRLATEDLAALVDLPSAMPSAMPAAEPVVSVAATPAAHDPQRLAEVLAQWLRAAVADVFGSTAEAFGLDDNLGYVGFNSLHYTLLAARLANELQVALNPALFFRYVSIAEIRDYLVDQHGEQLAAALLPATPAVLPTAVAPVVQAPVAAPVQADTPPAAAADGAIAIIGMTAVMPHAADVNAFWDNLRAGLDCSVTIPAERWDWRAVDGDPRGPGNFTNVHRAAFMEDVAGFDAGFFSIAPREAELMDPRQRMLLEAVWQCLEDGGQRPGALRGSRTGLFVGATGDEYAALSLQAGRDIEAYTLSGVSRTVLANRISYLFDWHGPSEVVDTACSSSLVAVHNAVRALRAGDCTMALAGGINVMIDPVPHICLNKIGMLAADGRCKTFDARADGYARGEGLGLVLLKPLDQALRDGDPVHAVLRGSAVNHGGRATALSAPNPAAQVDVISRAIRDAGIDCARLGYMEAHGTGTALGDPIEIEALKEAFATLRTGAAPLAPASVALSSVKPNVGHLEAAAGIAGLLKAILCVRHGELPATLHLQTLNPNIALDGTPFHIVRERSPWPQRDGLPRVAGVSSFGFGGVNAHVIVEQHVPAAPPAVADRPWLVPLSAHGDAQLRRMAHALADHIEAGQPRLCDVAFTMQTARDSMQERLLLRPASLAECVAQLRAYAGDGSVPADGWRGTVKGTPMRMGSSARKADVPAAPAADAAIETLAAHWREHGALAWPICPPEGAAGARRIALPTYAFAHTRYWLPTLQATQATPLLPALEGDSVTLSPTQPLLAGHQVGGRGVLPAAAYLALLRTHAGAGTWTAFADIVWTQPFVPEAPGERLRIGASTARDGRRQLRLSSERAGTVVEHCSALVLDDVRAPADAAPWTATPQLRRLDGAGCYRLFEEGGIVLGREYRTLRTLAHDAERAAAAIECTVADDASRWLLMVDGALQAIALHHALARPGTPPGVPFHVRRLVLVARCPAQATVQIELASGSSATARLPKYDARLFDGAGKLVGWIDACAGKPLPAARQAPAAPAHHYIPQWLAVPASPGTETAARGLLLGSAGDPVPQGWRALARAGAATAGIDATSESAWSAELGTGDALPDVVLLDYRRPAGANQPASLYQPFDETFALLRAAMRARLRRPLTVLALTSASSDPVIAPAVQALGAFGRAAANESPRLRLCVVDVQGDGVDLALLAACVSAAQADTGNAGPRPVNYRYHPASGRLDAEHLQEVAMPLGAGASLPAGSVVLVTGGAGGIGRLVASFLLGRGCRVALMGRSAPQQACRQLEADGLAPQENWQYVQADVADAAQVARALESVRRQWGPLRAVFHAAGGRADGLLLRKDAASTRAALEAKVAGTVVLDRLTQDDPLDYFVAFSSLASRLGPVGQTDYAYANAFLDGFTRTRNEAARAGLRRGLGIAVGWPLWQEGGMRMDEREQDYIRQLHGMEALATDAAMQCLFAILDSGHETVALAVGDKRKIDRSLLGGTAP